MNIKKDINQWTKSYIVIKRTKFTDTLIRNATYEETDERFGVVSIVCSIALSEGKYTVLHVLTASDVDRIYSSKKCDGRHICSNIF